MANRAGLAAIALFLLLAAEGAFAATHYFYYQGEMRQLTQGSDCSAPRNVEKISVLIQADGPGQPVDGYVMLPRVNLLHFSGPDLQRLSVDFPLDAAITRPQMQLHLRPAGILLNGEAEASALGPDTKGCFTRSAQLRLSPKAGATLKDFEELGKVFRLSFQASHAVPFERQGRFQEALPLRQQALATAESLIGRDSAGIAPYLTAVANLMQALARFEEAEALYRRAMSIDEKSYGPDAPILGEVLSSLAMTMYHRGRYGEAETLYRRAITIVDKEGAESVAAAALMVKLAVLMRNTGRLDAAALLASKALTIDEKVFGMGHLRTASDADVLASILRGLRRYPEAERVDLRVVCIREKALGPDHPLVASALNDLATVYLAIGRYDKAESLLRRSLAIVDKLSDLAAPSTGIKLLNLAAVLTHTGREDEALALALRAYRIARSTGEEPLSWEVPNELMRLYAHGKTPQPMLAIFYGKQAVNDLQKIRGNIGDSNKSAQSGFVGSVASVYRNLASLLSQENRLGEAQQVIAMMKEQEYFRFTQSDVALDRRITTSSLSASEKELAQLGVQVVTRAKELMQLQQKFQDNHEFSAADKARLDELRIQMDKAQEIFQSRADAVARSSTDPEAQRRRSQEINDFSGAFRATLKEMGHHAVLAQYFILDDHVTILLTTTDAMVARQATVKREELNRLILEYRDTLSSANRDPLPQAQALYKLLLRPIESDLKQAGAKTLMLSLDDTLRYLPFAALHDGKAFIIEDYSVVMVTEAARDKLAKAPKTSWTALGLGVTLAGKDYPALPYVAVELNDITGQQGVMTGKVLLDKAFNEESLRDGLDHAYPVVHIASHFQFTPGSMQDSFLLLGDGNHLTLAQIRTKLDFSNVELLTLSACDTALGDGHAEHHGDEVEGLGALAQQAGAKAVLATLWPVADRSTAILMRALYQAHKEAHLDKADALRSAQLALLKGAGELSGSSSDTDRGLGRISSSQSGAPGRASGTANYQHPFYWAPFVLMGNWL